MNMREFSRLTGLSSHTLRYYEKISLIKNVNRTGNGYRDYTNRDLEWINFVIRLKDTGMSIMEILKYAKLRDLGPTTLADRQELLETHRNNLNTKIASQLNHLAALDNKINLYRSKKVF